jgi:hypothetical protein
MPKGEIPLSERLIEKAKQFAQDAGAPHITNDGAFHAASREIRRSLAQIPAESFPREYSRIGQQALTRTQKVINEKGLAAGANFLFCQGVAASILETYTQQESAPDYTYFSRLAKKTAQAIRNFIK